MAWTFLLIEFCLPQHACVQAKVFLNLFPSHNVLTSSPKQVSTITSFLLSFQSFFMHIRYKYIYSTILPLFIIIIILLCVVFFGLFFQVWQYHRELSMLVRKELSHSLECWTAWTYHIYLTSSVVLYFKVASLLLLQQMVLKQMHHFTYVLMYL